MFNLLNAFFLILFNQCFQPKIFVAGGQNYIKNHKNFKIDFTLGKLNCLCYEPNCNMNKWKQSCISNQILSILQTVPLFKHKTFVFYDHITCVFIFILLGT